MVTLQFEARLLAQPLDPKIPAVMDGRSLILRVPAGQSLNRLLRDLDIQLKQPVSALVNGQATDLEQPLQPGDQARLLPQIAGGD